MEDQNVYGRKTPNPNSIHLTCAQRPLVDLLRDVIYRMTLEDVKLMYDEDTQQLVAFNADSNWSVAKEVGEGQFDAMDEAARVVEIAPLAQDHTLVVDIRNKK